MLTSDEITPHKPRHKLSFGEDFRRFFISGMAAVLPTLITLWVLVKLWDFLWDALGQHIIFGLGLFWVGMNDEPYGVVGRFWSDHRILERVVGVLLAILLVYIAGVLVGNFIGRTFYRLGERAAMRVPLVRAVYPAVKQVTDFVLNPKHGNQFASSRVVAVQPHTQNIWSVGLVTGGDIKPLSDVTGEEMLTVFVPSTPTAFSGYMLVVPRKNVVELPLSVEEAMRLLISGGVIVPAAAETAKNPMVTADSPLTASRINPAPS